MPVTDRGGIDMGKREKRMYREAIRNRYHWAKEADKDTIQAGSVQSAIISAGSRLQAESGEYLSQNASN
ncbi:hypothetical protein [Nitrosospira briensis]|uniref:hypothetical protein n=1 Tax=Nitrosospira briensis TaxID=35799 RepID=UPI0004685862|nr:hypothetical protein [Nitrosospira briensis]